MVSKNSYYLTGTVQFHWRKAEFLCNLLVSDCTSFTELHTTASLPLLSGLVSEQFNIHLRLSKCCCQGLTSRRQGQ